MSNPSASGSNNSNRTQIDEKMTDSAVPVPRSKTEAVRDLHYLIRLCRVHQRLHERMDRWGKLFELLGGSAALVSVASQSSVALAVAGVLVAVAAFANLVFEPSTKARRYQEAALALTDLLAKSDQMTLTALDAGRYCVALPGFIDALRAPSYNDTMHSHGLGKYLMPLSRMERFMAWLA